jgi:arylsulfatase A-like enzyme
MAFYIHQILLVLAVLPIRGVASDRPNILWITAEDMSPTLGCYGDPYANTPHLDAFAKQSVRFTRAFAVSPVCSPSRSCLITGVHPVTLGSLQMRSSLPLPRHVRGFPAFLRDAGYFCTNNVKTDYNTSDAERLIAESWDTSSATAHWRDPKRKADQPFFAVFNDMVSHQSRSMVWPDASFRNHVQAQLPKALHHDPDKAPVPPYYPDTSAIRKGLARYYDCVSVMDQNTGKILAQLEEDGLADDTIVFFFSDHGSGMPRHKRHLQDSGMRVALMVRVPKKWQHRATAISGSVSERLVSFLDLPPTVLRLAGCAVPDYMQGTSLLGKGLHPGRTAVYGSKDRIDEAFDMARSMRTERYLYIRNYQPLLAAHQASVYPGIATISGLFKTWENEPRVAEELYDCENDPHQQHNLSLVERTPDQAKAFEALRTRLMERQLQLRDLGALPESELWQWMRNEGKPIGDITQGVTNHWPDLHEAWAAANLVGKPNALSQMLNNLQSHAVAVRYWAVIGLRQAAMADSQTLTKVAEHLEDTAPSVRIETAAWLARHDDYQQRALSVLTKDLQHTDWWVALRACRAIELLGKRAASATEAMRAVHERTRPNTQSDANLFLAFSSSAFLKGLGEDIQPWDFSPEAKGREP